MKTVYVTNIEANQEQPLTLPEMFPTPKPPEGPLTSLTWEFEKPRADFSGRADVEPDDDEEFLLPPQMTFEE